MPYRAERRYYDQLRSGLTTEAKTEYELAIKTLVERYNTTIYENRFTVGGAVEVFTLVLLRSAGIDAKSYGSQTASGDIILPENKMLSVKSSFTKSGNIRLINKQGKGDRKWKTATLFVLSNVGMVYADPDMINEDELRDSGDAIEIRRRALRRVASNSNNVLDLTIPLKPPKEMTYFSHKASAAVAKQIMFEQELQYLLRHIGDNYSQEE